MGMELIQDLGVVLLVAAAAGWACRKAGISSVVGYLAAGLLTGPYTPPFQWVGSVERVRMLADLGLVFVIFGVGLGLSLGRMRRLGARVGIATMAGALIVLNACRFAGLWMGWDATTGLFLAGMLMVSSSAVISKSLEELQGTHERWGQMALGVTVMEDVVAVVMLTVLTSMGGGGGAGGLTGAGGQVWTTLWRLVSGRLARGGLNLLFVTALLLFWHPAVEAMVRGLGEDVGAKGGTRALFWVVFGLLLMGPLVALWRSSEAIAMVVAEAATQGRGWARPLRPWLELGLKAIGVLGLGAWLVAFLPLGGASPWVVTAAAGFVGVAGLLLSARLVRWHGRIEGEVRAELKRATTGTGALGMDLPGANEPGAQILA